MSTANRLLLLLLFVNYGYAQTNPLAALSAKNLSKEAYKFNEQVLVNVGANMAAAAFGITPTFEDFSDTIYNLTVQFLNLPIEDQKQLVSTYKAMNSKQVEAMENSKVFAEFDEIESCFNSVTCKALIDEVDEKFNMINETEEALEYLKSKNPTLGNQIAKFIRQLKEQYGKLNTQASKDFVYEALKIIQPIKGSEIDESSAETIQKKYKALSSDEQLDVLKKMTWFAKPIIKELYATILRSAQ